MCSTYDILASSPLGYLAICARCPHLELAFGTSLIRLPVEQLESFKQYLEKKVQETSDRNPVQKNVVLNIAGTESLQLVLTPHELLQLVDMLEKGVDEYKARQLINLFRHPGQA